MIDFFFVETSRSGRVNPPTDSNWAGPDPPSLALSAPMYTYIVDVNIQWILVSTYTN